jgi:hypothetical protein
MKNQRIWWFQIEELLMRLSIKIMAQEFIQRDCGNLTRFDITREQWFVGKLFSFHKRNKPFN